MIRYGIRALVKTFRTEFTSTTVIVLTVALAIAANTACFEFIDALWLKKQPGLTHTEDLLDLGITRRRAGFDLLSFPNFFDYQQQNKSFLSLAAYTELPRSMSLRTSEEPERVWGVPVTGNLFDVLQLKPAAGRFFLPEDEQPGHDLVAVISYGFWERRFERDASIVGRQVLINARPVTIIGVATKGFDGVNYSRTDVWVPVVTEMFHKQEDPFNRGNTFVYGIGRLKSGISLREAQAEMDMISAQLEKAHPDVNRGIGIRLVRHNPFSAIVSEGSVYVFVGMLAAIAILVLLIACANVAGVCLARSVVRTREIAIRIALGASRRRVIGQLMMETVALFAVAGLVAGVMASWLHDLVQRVPVQAEFLLPSPIAIDLAPDFRVVAFVITVTSLAALMSGLVPAFAATRVDPAASIKEEASAWTFRRSRLRNALVVAQVGTSLLLLIVAGLFVRSISLATAVDTGLDPNNLEAISLNWFISGFRGDETGEALESFEKTLLARISALPYVDGASLAVDVPMDGVGIGFNVITVPGQEQSPERGTACDWNLVSPGYFKTMGIPILRGRDFGEFDRAGVAIVNETMARRFWPGQDAIGKQLYDGTSANGRRLEVIGVAKDTNARYVGQPADPLLYAPLGQYSTPRHYLMVRTTNGTSVVPDLRKLLREISPDMPIISVQSMKELMRVGLLPQRIASSVAASMGFVGVLLASLGLYAIVSFSVSTRTREIGIRTAVGARHADILKLMFREGIRLTVSGVMAGWILALALTRLIARLLFGISPMDILTLAITSITLAIITLLAAYLPARRATKVDPIVALRHE
jgi:macrolide transport system ATP-binding/permease protein